jgi:hypothetical protein
MKRTLPPFALMALLGASIIPTMADTVYNPGPEGPPYLINPSAPGVDTLEAFIETPGMDFDSPGFVNLDSGWNDVDVNPTYSLEYGTLSASLAEQLDIIGSSPTLTIDYYGFTGCASLQPISACPVEDLTDAYAALFNDGTYRGYTALTADDLASENTTDTLPEPATILLIGSGLIGLAVRRYCKL